MNSRVGKRTPNEQLAKTWKIRCLDAPNTTSFNLFKKAETQKSISYLRTPEAGGMNEKTVAEPKKREKQDKTTKGGESSCSSFCYFPSRARPNSGEQPEQRKRVFFRPRTTGHHWSRTGLVFSYFFLSVSIGFCRVSIQF